MDQPARHKVPPAALRVLSLVAQNRESRIARFPESRAGIARNSAARSKKLQKIESNRSKVELRKIDSESPSESRPNNA